MATASASSIPFVSNLNGAMLHHGRRREKSRTLLILPVSVRLGYREHVDIIQDVSASGIFLYSDFKPPIAAEVELKVTLPAPAKPQRIAYRGIAGRVTTGVLALSGAKPGGRPSAERGGNVMWHIPALQRAAGFFEVKAL